MSDIVEKTLTALPGLFLQNPGAGGPASATASFSSRLGGLVRGIAALTSKHVGAGGAGRSGTPGGGPRPGRPWSRGEPSEPVLPRGSATACVPVRFCVCLEAALTRTDTWEAGFPRLARTLTPYDLGADLFDVRASMCFLNVGVESYRYVFRSLLRGLDEPSSVRKYREQ